MNYRKYLKIFPQKPRWAVSLALVQTKREIKSHLDIPSVHPEFVMFVSVIFKGGQENCTEPFMTI